MSEVPVPPRPHPVPSRSQPPLHYGARCFNHWGQCLSFSMRPHRPEASHLRLVQPHPYLPTRLVLSVLSQPWSHPASFLHCWCCLFTGQEGLKGAVHWTESTWSEEIFSGLTGIRSRFTGVSLQQDVPFYGLPWVLASFIRFPGGWGVGPYVKANQWRCRSDTRLRGGPVGAELQLHPIGQAKRCGCPQWTFLSKWIFDSVHYLTHPGCPLAGSWLTGGDKLGKIPGGALWGVSTVIVLY